MNRTGWLIQEAILDPVGIRIALEGYGLQIGWPALQLGPIEMKEGQLKWRLAVMHATPLMLGLAWKAVEERDAQLAGQRPKGQDDQNKEREENTMPVIQWTEFNGVEPGNYSAVIESIEDTDGQFGPQLQFEFRVLDSGGNQTDATVRGWCSSKWGPKAKLYGWATAILRNKCPKANQPIDTDVLIGRKCDLVVKEYAKPDGQKGTKIDAVYPFKSMTAAFDDDDELDENGKVRAF